MFRTLAAEASPSVSPDNTKVRLDLEEPEGRFRADIFAGLIFARFHSNREERISTKKMHLSTTGIYIGECMPIGILVIQIIDAEKI